MAAPLVGLTLVHPAMLGGLALASLPIIIHLLNRRRFKRMEWAAMEFLLRAAVRNRRRVRLENLLLLLLRTLIVVLLITAVSRPFVSRESGFAALFGAEGAIDRVILLDNSHSMRAGQGNNSAFRTAQRILRQLINRLHDQRSGDRVTIVLGSDPRGGDQQLARVAVASAHYKRMLDRIEKLRPSDGVLDVAEAIDSILENHRSDDSRLVLHIVSDFRQRDWTGPDGRPHPDLLEALGRFARRGEIRFLDVGSDPVQNLGIVELRPRGRAVIAGVPTTFEATVRNHGPGPASHFTVEFRFGGHREVGYKHEGVLEPGRQVTITREFTLREPGPVTVSAHLPTDILPGDDVRRRVVSVRRDMRFLLVDGEPDPEPYRGETDFLAAALAPPGRTASGIGVDVVEEQAFTGRELGIYDGVFLCNVYRLPPDRVKRLEEYVRGGGGLVFFIGDQVDPQIYNATLLGSGDRMGQGLLPLRLHEVEGSSEDFVNFSAPDLDHPLTRFLRGMNEIVFRTVSVRHFMAGSIPVGGDARVLLRYTDDASSPAMAEKPYGDGRVVIFTLPPDREWSNFPNSILFLALLQETARFVVKPDSDELTRIVGEPIRLAFDPRRMQRAVTLVPPGDLGGAPVRLAPEGKDLLFAYDRTTVAGTYELRLKTPEGDEFVRPYAFNVDPGEGRLARADLVQLASDLPGTRIERAGDEALFDAGESDRTEFWRTLFYILIACVALETLLAWRFGHHARRKAGLEGKQVFVR